MSRDACAVCGRPKIAHVIAVTIDHAFVSPLERKATARAGAGRKARATTCPIHRTRPGAACPGGDCQARKNEAAKRTRLENIAARVAAGRARR